MNHILNEYVVEESSRVNSFNQIVSRYGLLDHSPIGTIHGSIFQLGFSVDFSIPYDLLFSAYNILFFDPSLNDVISISFTV